jgi:RND family efflux transporter MFP subunit
MQRSSGVVAWVLACAVLGGATACGGGAGDTAQVQAATAGSPGGGPRGGPGGGRGRPPMTVELAAAKTDTLAESITVVGNLIGAATVQVVPKVNGRLDSVAVRLGDRVSKGQTIARVDDREIREQVRQAEASHDVAAATIRQREADLKFAQTNLDRSRSLFDRQLLPKQSMDDADARFQAATAQLDLARAQFAQARARLDELQITLNNTVITSPVDGFVGKRFLDSGAWVSSSAPVVSVVDISLVRLVANLVERDLRRVTPGVPGRVEVDAYPGEIFRGRVARVAPVLDPATRTAEMEIEIANGDARLKPGMYARVQLTVGERSDALVVPRNALVHVDGRSGVFVAVENAVRFQPVAVGLQGPDTVEILDGLQAGDSVVTTGAGALSDGDPILVAGAEGQGPRGRQPDARPAAAR